MRGWLARKKVQELRQQIFSPGMGHYPQDGREDYDNVNVQEMRAQLGEFCYDDDQFERQLGDREQRIMVILENGARYEGEWLLSTQIRQGRGI